VLAAIGLAEVSHAGILREETAFGQFLRPTRCCSLMPAGGFSQPK
jgi:hypothetical protein